MKKNVCVILFVLVIILLISSCGIIRRACHRSINRLDKEIVPFSSLPVEVKEFFNLPTSERQERYGRNRNLITINTAFEYELVHVGMIDGRRGERSNDMWISHYLLIDKTNNITYRFNFTGSSAIITFPVIVFDREIFMATDLNIFTELGFYRRRYEFADDDTIFLLWKNRRGGLHEPTFYRFSLESDRRFRRRTRHLTEN